MNMLSQDQLILPKYGCDMDKIKQKNIDIKQSLQFGDGSFFQLSKT